LTAASTAERRSRGVKINVAVDKYGIPLAIDVSLANRHDTKAIVQVLRTLAEGGFEGAALGDLGHRGERLANVGETSGNDAIALVVLWRLRYKLSLGDLTEMFLKPRHRIQPCPLLGSQAHAGDGRGSMSPPARHEKRDRLPADELLRRAGAPIQEWWRRAYLGEDIPLLPQRFVDEARASLPGLGDPTTVVPEEVFAALRVQRLRLRHDQQVPEWSGSIASVATTTA
jgi:hypothetical protein